MLIKEIGVVKFVEVCIKIFDFELFDKKLSINIPNKKDMPFYIDKYLTEKLYPLFMEYDIKEWSLEKFMATSAKDNKKGKNKYWLKTKMRVVN